MDLHHYHALQKQFTQLCGYDLRRLDDIKCIPMVTIFTRT